jgi:hypothetical protein
MRKVLSESQGGSNWRSKSHLGVLIFDFELAVGGFTGNSRNPPRVSAVLNPKSPILNPK